VVIQSAMCPRLSGSSALERVVAMQCGSQRRRRCLCATGIWHPEKRRPDRVSVLRGGVCVLGEGGGPARQHRRRSDAPVSAGRQRRV
jgi:hypothetical protein